VAKLRLQVETVLPAEASAQAQAARARGDAASTVENGKAAAEALAAVANEWTAAGACGREVYVLQQLDQIVMASVKRVEQLDVGAIEIVDGGDASNLVALLGSFAQGVSKVLEETARAVGVDMRSLIAPRPPSPGSMDAMTPKGAPTAGGGV
jgi:flotillin